MYTYIVCVCSWKWRWSLSFHYIYLVCLSPTTHNELFSVLTHMLHVPYITDLNSIRASYLYLNVILFLFGHKNPIFFSSVVSTLLARSPSSFLQFIFRDMNLKKYIYCPQYTRFSSITTIISQLSSYTITFKFCRGKFCKIIVSKLSFRYFFSLVLSLWGGPNHHCAELHPSRKHSSYIIIYYYIHTPG